MQRQRADAHKHAALAVLAEGLLDAAGHGLQILAGGILVHLVDQRHILLTDADDEVVLPVGEQPLDHVHRDALQPLIHRAHHKDAAGSFGGNVQLLGTHIDVADKDVVGDDVLDERTLVVLFLVIALGGVQGHGGHGTDGAAHAVVAAGEHSVVKAHAPAGQRLEAFALQGDTGTLGGGDGLNELGPLLADARQLAAGDDRSLRVDDADGAIRGLFELKHCVLEYPARHSPFLLRKPA